MSIESIAQQGKGFQLLCTLATPTNSCCPAKGEEEEEEVVVVVVVMVKTRE